jgi:hypothetical protein
MFSWVGGSHFNDKTGRARNKYSEFHNKIPKIVEYLVEKEFPQPGKNSSILGFFF